jgi:hypothetical protein
MPNQPVPDPFIDKPKGPCYPLHGADFPSEKINQITVNPIFTATSTADIIVVQ